MCLATVYVETDGQRKEVMRDVAWIRQQGRELELTTLMRETQLLQATIKSIDLMTSSIILERAASSAAHDQVRLKGQDDG